METQIKKWGNSLGIRLPKAFAEEVKLKEGGRVNVSLEDGRIVLIPLASTENLFDLLSKITPENVHEEFNLGRPSGKEAW